MAQVRRVAAMLDLDPDGFVAGQPLPRGWQFLLLGADTRRSALRIDGFPGLGVPMPDLGLPRLMLGSRSVRFEEEIPIGADVSRSSAILDIRHKSGASGPMALVEIEHRLQVQGCPTPALVERQTYVLMSATPANSAASPASGPADSAVTEAPPVSAEHQRRVVPDEILLFHYSALGFNSHRIHLDREHAREREGFPDLVVNGGLATLLLTEFLRRDLGLRPRSLAVRHVAPLFCNRPVTLTADRVGERWLLKAFDDRHRPAVEMQVEVT